MEIGAQLYTVRDFTKTLDDFAETLKKVADIGYRTVQVSGTCPFEAGWLETQLAENGLRCVITHTPPARIAEETKDVIAQHRIFGCEYIGIGMMPDGVSGYESFIKTFKPVAKKIAGAGMLLMYHNHSLEFQRTGKGREIYLDRLISDFSPEELGITLDTYWVQAGGGDPAKWLKKLSGRVPCVHLKDMTVMDGKQRMAPVGEGNMNMDAILYAADAANAQYLLVEQDDCYGTDPFECLRRSYENLNALGLD